MKILKFIIAMFVMALSCTSCLESNFEELDTYDGQDMLGIATRVTIS